MNKVTFFVPEIRGKGRPRMTRSGIAFTDEKTRNYENLVKMIAVKAMEEQGFTQPIDAPICAVIHAYFEIPKSYTKKKRQQIINGEIKPAKPDIDNIIKSIFDGCNKIVFRDDAQICNLIADKSYITNLERYGVYVEFQW